MDEKQQLNYAAHGEVNSLIALQAISAAVAEERERCAKIVRRICGETAHVKLGDAIETAIFNL